MRISVKLVVLWLLTCLAITGIFAGCSGPGEVKTYTVPGQTISAGVDQEFIIQAVGDPSGGPDWQPSFDSSAVALIEKNFQNNPAGSKTGLAGGVENFKFKALKKGQTKIGLVLMKAPMQLTPQTQVTEFPVSID